MTKKIYEVQEYGIGGWRTIKKFSDFKKASQSSLGKMRFTSDENVKTRVAIKIGSNLWERVFPVKKGNPRNEIA